MVNAKYVDRFVDSQLAEVLEVFPAVLVAGPRAAGKTTSARRLARSVLQLDRQAERVALSADPDSVLLSLPEPILIDEWQQVPDVLGAVKRLVDADSRPNRFILTGSARSDALADGWPATGRVIRLTQWPMTQREVVGRSGSRSLLDLAFDEPACLVNLSCEPTELREYVELALRGGYPEAVRLASERNRAIWLESYIEQLVTRDASLVHKGRDPRRLQRYLQALAASTAGLAAHKVLYDSAGIDRETALAYDGLLELLFVCEQVPAWSSNLLSRLNRSPKRYVSDPSLLGPLTALDARGALRDGDRLGRLIDTFVHAQLRSEALCSLNRPTISHLRLDDGRRELDLVLELADSRVLAVEIKASSAPTLADARHLLWFAEQMGDLFTAGIVFHTGPRPFQLAPSVVALPISSIWSPDLV